MSAHWSNLLLCDRILKAARADSIPEDDSGLWYVKKVIWTEKMAAGMPNFKVPVGAYTKLFRWTEATMHQGIGECVMDDTVAELKKHLRFMLMAHGDVIVSGLGLGCVVRGLLLNPKVRSVKVLEISKNVLKLVEPWMPKDPRLTIIHADALKWFDENPDAPMDCVWHDIWTDESKGEPHLQVQHMALLSKSAGRVDLQGAWNFPREFRRMMKSKFKVI